MIMKETKMKNKNFKRVISIALSALTLVSAITAMACTASAANLEEEQTQINDLADITIEVADAEGLVLISNPEATGVFTVDLDSVKD